VSVCNCHDCNHGLAVGCHCPKMQQTWHDQCKHRAGVVQPACPACVLYPGSPPASVLCKSCCLVLTGRSTNAVTPHTGLARLVPRPARTPSTTARGPRRPSTGETRAPPVATGTRTWGHPAAGTPCITHAAVTPIVIPPNRLGVVPDAPIHSPVVLPAHAACLVVEVVPAVRAVTHTDGVDGGTVAVGIPKGIQLTSV
jgi:hypothetical protein